MPTRNWQTELWLVEKYGNSMKSGRYHPKGAQLQKDDLRRCSSTTGDGRETKERMDEPSRGPAQGKVKATKN